MSSNRFPSFFLSLCLHLGLAALILFLPSFSMSRPEPPRQITVSGLVTLGKPGGSKPSPAKPPEAAPGKTEKPSKPVEKPAAPEEKHVAKVDKPTPPEPKPEIKPVEKPQAKPEPKPEPKPEAAPIPKDPEKKSAEKKKPPQNNATKAKAPDKTTTAAKKEPPKKPDKKTTKKGSSVEDALLALSKETKQQGAKEKTGQSGAPGKGQKADDVLQSWEKEFGGSHNDMQGNGSGDDAQGDGPGGFGGDGRGSPGPYYEVIISRVRQNWSMTQRADRTVYVAVVNIQIAPDGSILSRQIVSSSGNALYDSAVLLAIDNTRDLEPPPSPDLRDINIEFDSNEMNRQ